MSPAPRRRGRPRRGMRPDSLRRTRRPDRFPLRLRHRFGCVRRADGGDDDPTGSGHGHVVHRSISGTKGAARRVRNSPRGRTVPPAGGPARVGAPKRERKRDAGRANRRGTPAPAPRRPTRRRNAVDPRERGHFTRHRKGSERGGAATEHDHRAPGQTIAPSAGSRLGETTRCGMTLRNETKPVAPDRRPGSARARPRTGLTRCPGVNERHGSPEAGPPKTGPPKRDRQKRPLAKTTDHGRRTCDLHGKRHARRYGKRHETDAAGSARRRRTPALRAACDAWMRTRPRGRSRSKRSIVHTREDTPRGGP